MFELVEDKIRGMRKELSENGTESCNEWKYADDLALYVHGWHSRLATSCIPSSDCEFLLVTMIYKSGGVLLRQEDNK